MIDILVFLFYTLVAFAFGFYINHIVSDCKREHKLIKNLASRVKESGAEVEVSDRGGVAVKKHKVVDCVGKSDATRVHLQVRRQLWKDEVVEAARGWVNSKDRYSSELHTTSLNELFSKEPK